MPGLTRDDFELFEDGRPVRITNFFAVETGKPVGPAAPAELEPGEIDFFPRVFGDRAKIYPKGGHCGNMDHRDNVAHMVNVFRP